MTTRSAMILAAGRGERLAPLTEVTPKPLIQIGGKALIDYHLYALADAGVTQITVNVAHLGQKIVDHLNDICPEGTRIDFSHEPQGALETAGGIHHALDLIESDPFIVVNADIWTVHKRNPGSPTLTYSGIGLYQKDLFADCDSGRFPLAPVLNNAAQIGELSGQVYRGTWMDIGTPQRLTEARRRAQGNPV